MIVNQKQAKGYLVLHQPVLGQDSISREIIESQPRKTLTKTLQMGAQVVHGFGARRTPFLNHDSGWYDVDTAHLSPGSRAH